MPAQWKDNATDANKKNIKEFVEEQDKAIQNQKECSEWTAFKTWLGKDFKDFKFGEQSDAIKEIVLPSEGPDPEQMEKMKDAEEQQKLAAENAAKVEEDLKQ